MLAAAFGVRTAVQNAARIKTQIIDLVCAHLIGRGQNANPNPLPARSNHGGGAFADNFNARPRAAVQKPCKIHLQCRGQVPQRGHCGRGFASLNLADHRTADARQFRHSVQ
jgi:hypothetical protein